MQAPLYSDVIETNRRGTAMEDWRLIAFAVLMIVLVAVGTAFLQRRRRAQRTGDDPVYGVASLAPETVQPQAAPRTRGIGTTGE